MDEGSITRMEISFCSLLDAQRLGQCLSHADTRLVPSQCECWTNTLPDGRLSQSFHGFLVKPLPKNKARFQEPSVRLEQLQRHSITQIRAVSPSVLMRSGFSQRTEKYPPDLAPAAREAAVTSRRDTDSSPHPSQLPMLLVNSAAQWALPTQGCGSEFPAVSRAPLRNEEWRGTLDSPPWLTKAPQPDSL